MNNMKALKNKSNRPNIINKMLSSIQDTLDNERNEGRGLEMESKAVSFNRKGGLRK